MVLGVAGLAVGLIGIALSVYFFVSARSLREPILMIDPARTQIVSKQRISSAPIRVLKPDGSEITSDVTAVRFYFWNDGRESIRRGNILKPVVLTLSDANGEILDFSLLATSREVTGLIVRRHIGSASRALQIDFDILEQNDGGTGQIIFTGDSAAEFNITGVIEGVRFIETNRTLSFTRKWRVSIVAIGAILYLASAGLFLGIVLQVVDALRRRRSRLGQAVGIMFAICFIGGAVYGFWIGPLKDAQQDFERNVPNRLPQNIAPKP